MQNIEEEESYSFTVEWNDPVASTVREFTLTYWPSDKSVSMVTYDLLIANKTSHLTRILNNT